MVMSASLCHGAQRPFLAHRPDTGNSQRVPWPCWLEVYEVSRVAICAEGHTQPYILCRTQLRIQQKHGELCHAACACRVQYTAVPSVYRAVHSCMCTMCIAKHWDGAAKLLLVA